MTPEQRAFGAGEQGPIEAATAELTDWLARVSGEPVRLGPLADLPVNPTEDAKPGLVLWPLELRPERQTRGVGVRHPYRFTVRCLVAGALAALDRVLIEAVRTGKPPLSLDGIDWSAVRATPRPVLVFDIPATVSHPAPDTPLVLGPLVLKQGELRPLTGDVLGPGGQPVADVRVEVAGTDLAAYTDRRGRFNLAGVPGGDRIGLRLSGRGRAFTADVDLTDGGPVIIRCTFDADN